jgi:hypothetical protein
MTTVSSASPPASASTEYLTPGQAATMLQVCEKTLGRWAKADPTLPVLKILGTTRYPRERLLRWLRDREQGRQPSRIRMRSSRNDAPAKVSS